MSAHTPGPWHVHEGASDGCLVATTAYGDKVISGEFSVSGESEANARLIAAAPSLLEALVIAEGFIREICSIHKLPEPTATGARLRAAIARATGEPQ